MNNNGTHGGRARLAITAGLAAAIAFGGVAAPTLQANAETITVNQAIKGTYKAYKLINGTFIKKDDGKVEISEASLVEETKGALIQVLRDAGCTIDESHGDAALVNSVTDALTKLYDSNDLQSVANKLVKQLEDNKVAPTKEATATSDTLTFEGVDQGYYLVAATNVDGAKTSAMLMPVTNEGGGGTLKGTTPTVTKKIDDPDAGLVTGKGNTLPVISSPTYTITGTVSSNIADFNTYKYSLVDTMPKGVDVTQDEIKNGGPWGAKIKVFTDDVKDAVDVTSMFTTSVNANTEGRFVATWSTTDLKAILQGAGIKDMADAKVVLTYSPVYDAQDIKNLYENFSTLNDPQINSVKVEYSNDPYAGGEGGTKPTPPDDSKLYSYNLQLKKIDEKGAALTGAEFTLTDDKGNTVGKNIASDENGVFKFTGLDAEKQYTLTETKVPTGKKGIAPIKFTIKRTMDSDGETVKSITFEENEDPSKAATFTVDSENSAIIDVNVTNVAGPDLPLTGQAGIVAGVTVGGVLIAVSAAAMVRKRKNAAE